MIYLKYLKQIFIHRWFVAVECWKYGLWLAPFLHDNSKLGPTEFFAYANHFMGEKNDETKAAFDYAWNHHWKVNKHHGMYWVVEINRVHSPQAEMFSDDITYQDARVKVLKIPLRYVIEMYCDWVAAGKAYTGSNNVRMWYENNKSRMVLHPDTQWFIEELVNARNDGERKFIIKHHRSYRY